MKQSILVIMHTRGLDEEIANLKEYCSLNGILFINLVPSSHIRNYETDDYRTRIEDNARIFIFGHGRKKYVYYGHDDNERLNGKQVVDMLFSRGIVIPGRSIHSIDFLQCFSDKVAIEAAEELAKKNIAFKRINGSSTITYVPEKDSFDFATIAENTEKDKRDRFEIESLALGKLSPLKEMLQASLHEFICLLQREPENKKLLDTIIENEITRLTEDYLKLIGQTNSVINKGILSRRNSISRQKALSRKSSVDIGDKTPQKALLRRKSFNF